MKYKVKVIETLEKVIEIQAESPKQAKEIAEEMWFNSELDMNELDNQVSHEIYIVSNI